MCGQNDFYQDMKYRSSQNTIMLRSVYQRNMASTKHIFSKKKDLSIKILKKKYNIIQFEIEKNRLFELSPNCVKNHNSFQ